MWTEFSQNAVNRLQVHFSSFTNERKMVKTKKEVHTHTPRPRFIRMCHFMRLYTHVSSIDKRMINNVTLDVIGANEEREKWKATISAGDRWNEINIIRHRSRQIENSTMNSKNMKLLFSRIQKKIETLKMAQQLPNTTQNSVIIFHFFFFFARWLVIAWTRFFVFNFLARVDVNAVCYR